MTSSDAGSLTVEWLGSSADAKATKREQIPVNAKKVTLGLAEGHHFILQVRISANHSDA